MTYIVNDSCIRCKLMDCVSVCPVDCFYEGENILVIHPDECIDCAVCVAEEAVLRGESCDRALRVEVMDSGDCVVLTAVRAGHRRHTPGGRFFSVIGTGERVSVRVRDA